MPEQQASSPDALLRRERQVVHWRLLAATFGMGDEAPHLDHVAGEVAADLGLPSDILHPTMAVDTLLQRYPELKGDFHAMQKVCQPPVEEISGDTDDSGSGKEQSQMVVAPAIVEEDPDAITPAVLRREMAYSKLLLNVFGPNTLAPTLTVEQYRQWQQACNQLGSCFGFSPGNPTGGGNGRGGGASGRGDGGAYVTEEHLKTALGNLEGDLMKRIALREILKDDALAAQLPSNMAVVEQLLLDKGNLSGNALKNAKQIIQRYVDELVEAIKKKVTRAVKGRIDRSVPPKRVFRNLDLKRTVWKNLIHYNPQDRRLYVDQLHYRQTASKTLPKRLIIVVDQSGSMVDAMVQTAILGSIFATLPKVEVHLIAFDTNVIDLTEWVREPFETLMRTNLGGGTDGTVAMPVARDKVQEPRNTTMVWISDFFDNQALFEMIKQVKESGVRFIPVGALKSGYFSVNTWFRDKLKQIGLPILHGRVEKLIEQLKDLL